MAGRARPPSTESDPDLSSPSAKRSKLSESSSDPDLEPKQPCDEPSTSTTTTTTTTVTTTTTTSLTESSQLQESQSEPKLRQKKTPFSDLSLESSEVLPSSDESFCEEENKVNVSTDQLPQQKSSPLASASEATTSSNDLHLQQQQREQVELIMGREGSGEGSSVQGSEQHQHYQDLLLIGDGAYGTVYKAKDPTSGQVVALKKIRVPLTNNGLPPYTVREISTLKQLNQFQHPQIVKLLDVCQGTQLQLITKDGKSERVNDGLTYWLVFEHIERDLASFMDACRVNDISPELKKRMAKEILLGVDFLHSQRVIHRDLKPQNLLVTKDQHIKIADFGLAKTYDFEMRLTSVVVTLWYRAPEVLLRCSYASPIDIWSVGCIIAELSECKPLFPGNSEGDQLDRIFGVIGTPPEEEWPEDVSLGRSAFPFRHSIPLKRVIPSMCDSGLDLVKNMLIFNPHKRLTAIQALQHPYFTTDDL